MPKFELAVPLTSESREAQNCRVCRESPASCGATEAGRRFQFCIRCGATTTQFDDISNEAAREDQSCRRLGKRVGRRSRSELAALLKPLFERLPGGASGLNFQCGPSPLGTLILRELGFKCHDYDPVFAPFSAAISRTYDFVVCIDACEQTFDPAAQFDLLEDLVDPGGWLLISTRTENESSFTALEQGLIAHYGPDTLRCVASDRKWEAVVQDNGLSLFRMPGSAASE